MIFFICLCHIAFYSQQIRRGRGFIIEFSGFIVFALFTSKQVERGEISAYGEGRLLIFSGKFFIINLNRRSASRGALSNYRANCFGGLFRLFFNFYTVSWGVRK